MFSATQFRILLPGLVPKSATWELENYTRYRVCTKNFHAIYRRNGKFKLQGKVNKIKYDNFIGMQNEGGFNNYGRQFFNLFDRTQNLVYRSKNLSNVDFFSERVSNYWNKLPEAVKDKSSVNAFKNALDNFRSKGITNNLSGQFWELSDEIYKRIQSV